MSWTRARALSRHSTPAGPGPVDSVECASEFGDPWSTIDFRGGSGSVVDASVEAELSALNGSSSPRNKSAGFTGVPMLASPSIAAADDPEEEAPQCLLTAAKNTVPPRDCWRLGVQSVAGNVRGGAMDVSEALNRNRSFCVVIL